MRGKKGILFIRGKNLNPWDMQMYEPLKDEFRTLAVVHPRNRFDTSPISFPLIRMSDMKNFIGDPFSMTKAGKKKYFFRNELSKLLWDVDIVHTAELFTNYTYTICSLKEKFHYKIVTTVWENIPWKSVYEEDAFEKRKFCEPRVDKIIAPTIFTKNSLLLEGIDENKIIQIYPGFNLSLFKPNKADGQLLMSLGLTKNDFIILFIGRMTYQKGIFEVLPAAKLLLQDTELTKYQLKFILLGKGEEERNVFKLLHLYGIEDAFVIKNDVHYQDIIKYYNLAKIFICPSMPEKNWREQFGMVFIESMASGVVPVGSSTGAIPEVIGDAGLLVLPGDYQDLKAKLKMLILNDNLRNKLKRKGLQRAKEQFDQNIQAMKIANVYRNL